MMHFFTLLGLTAALTQYQLLVDENKPVQPKESKTDKAEVKLAMEMSHDLQMNFNKIAPFGKEDTAKELQTTHRRLKTLLWMPLKMQKWQKSNVPYFEH
jgi:hypothetical protein